MTTLARLSVDDFVIHCEDLDGPSQADAIAARADAAPVNCGMAGLPKAAQAGVAPPRAMRVV